MQQKTRATPGQDGARIIRGGYDYESKTQYRYADKQFIKSGYPSVSGYTQSSKNLISTSYGNYTTNSVSASTSRNSSYTTEVTGESKSAYYAYSYVCDCMKYFWCNNKGAHKHSDGKKHYTSNRLNIYSTKSLAASGHPGEWDSGVYGYKCAQNYYRGSTHKIGYVYCLSYKGKFVASYSSKTYTWLWQNSSKTTVYRPVTKKYNFTHWKWGSYSNWSDSYVSSNSNRKVQTRTLYRYKIYPKAQSITTSKSTYKKTFGDAPFSLGAKAKTKLTYKSSNTNIATVSSAGKVTLKNPGTAKITVKAASSAYYKSATKVVTITSKLKTPGMSLKVESKRILRWTIEKPRTPGASKYEIWTLHPGENDYRKKMTAAGNSISGTFEVDRGGTYKCKIRAYRTVSGKKIYSSYSAARSVKVK